MLPDALASVWAQTHDDYQIIVNYSEKYWPSKINEAAAAAKGEYLLILCDDDMIAPTYLARTVQFMPHADIVTTELRTFGDSEQVWAPRPYAFDHLKLTSTPWITSLVRRSLWEELGGYDEALIYQDWDFWYRAFKTGAKCVRIHEPLFLYRLHVSQGTKQVDQAIAREQIYTKHPELRPDE